MLTSAGSQGNDKQTQILLNVRAFADDNSSGHGLSCSSYVKDFHPESRRKKSGRKCEKSARSKTGYRGKIQCRFLSHGRC